MCARGAQGLRRGLGLGLGVRVQAPNVHGKFPLLLKVREVQLLL